MQPIQISVSGREITVLNSGVLTAGTVGLPVEFQFDPSWDALEKTAVFRAYGRTMDCLALTTTAAVPWELLKAPGCHLYVGVYGTNSDGTLQIPTVWADMGVIQPGADPTGDESTTPSLPGWQQLRQELENALEAIITYQEKIISGQIVPKSMEAGEKV